MNLTRAQRRFAVVGLLVSGGLAIYPPWTKTMRGFSENGGYAPLWNPPSQAEGWTVRVAWDRLTLSWVVVGTLTAVAFMAFRNESGNQRR